VAVLTKRGGSLRGDVPILRFSYYRSKLWLILQCRCLTTNDDDIDATAKEEGSKKESDLRFCI
jgi:hypothetical protein